MSWVFGLPSNSY